MKKLLLVTAALLAFSGVANTKTFTCTGEVWNTTETRVEVGHGLAQCTIEGDATSAVRHKIMSVCMLGYVCTFRVNIVSKATKDQDNLVVTDKDKVLSVRRGVADNREYFNE